ncbi:MAG: methionyl-tRNA formyltransferase [Desulfomonilaceae bacterium]
MNLRVVFMGSPEFAVATLRALNANFLVTGVVTQPDKPRGRGQKTLASAVKTAAVELGLPVVQPTDLGSQDIFAALGQWKPDVIVVAAYGKILPPRILSLPRMGCVNLHASLLPRYRGASPIGAAILGGDKVTGVCTILMDHGMDTGDILLQKEIDVLENDTTGTLHDRLMAEGAGLAVETLRRMAENRVQAVPQDHENATYTRLLTKEDGRIQWERDAEYLARLVRAMNPWPGAFSEISGDSVKVWEASALEGTEKAGYVAGIQREGVLVGTGRGLLLLRQVQAPGRKRVSAAEFARWRRLGQGEALKHSKSGAP